MRLIPQSQHFPSVRRAKTSPTTAPGARLTPVHTAATTPAPPSQWHSQITNKRIELVSTLKGKPSVRAQGGRDKEKRARYSRRGEGLTSLIPHCLPSGGERRRGGGNPLSQKVVGVKNSPPLTPISKIPLMGDIKGLKYEWTGLWNSSFLEEWGNLGVVTLVGCDSGGGRGGVRIRILSKKRRTQLALELQFGLDASWYLQTC